MSAPEIRLPAAAKRSKAERRNEALRRESHRRAMAATAGIESVPGLTVHLNQRGENIGYEAASFAGKTTTISVPRVRWLERETRG